MDQAPFEGGEFLDFSKNKMLPFQNTAWFSSQLLAFIPLKFFLAEQKWLRLYSAFSKLSDKSTTESTSYHFYC